MLSIRGRGNWTRFLGRGRMDSHSDIIWGERIVYPESQRSERSRSLTNHLVMPIFSSWRPYSGISSLVVLHLAHRLLKLTSKPISCCWTCGQLGSTLACLSATCLTSTLHSHRLIIYFTILFRFACDPTRCHNLKSENLYFKETPKV